jgi:hypothetical protein
LFFRLSVKSHQYWWDLAFQPVAKVFYEKYAPENAFRLGLCFKYLKKGMQNT